MNQKLCTNLAPGTYMQNNRRKLLNPETGDVINIPKHSDTSFSQINKRDAVKFTEHIEV